MRALLVLLIFTASASAAPKTFGDGLKITFHDHSLFVHAKDGHEAALGPAENFTDFTFDAAKQEVTIEFETRFCQIGTHEVWSLASLNARLENTPAFALHKKKDFKAALAGFQRAIAADPTWPIPAYNAASAQQLLGDKPAAIATLAPWLKQAPVRTYLQIHQDPELAPLSDRAEVKAIEAAKPADVEVTHDGITGGAAFSPTHKLLAIARTEGSWGDSQFVRDIELYDMKGVFVTKLSLVLFDETNTDCYTGDLSKCELSGKAAKKKVGDRAASVQQLLRALGFSRAKTEGGEGSLDGDKRKVPFAAHKLGLVERNGSIRILRGDHEVTTSSLDGAKLVAALLVEEVNAVVVWSRSPGAEGCQSMDPASVQIIPLN
jgi:tetratricopeptide (TPR) repeat protein